MKVQAKFTVQEHREFNGTPNSKTIVLRAVYGDSLENKSWSQYTPSGTIEMQITNPAAVAEFPLGRTMLITFEEYPRDLAGGPK